MGINPWTYARTDYGRRERCSSVGSRRFLPLPIIGIKFTPRAPQQHTRIVERRGALFRDVIHRTDAQLEIEGLLDIPFEYRLAEAAFAGNALVTVNNTTPYNAVYGRVPSLLPNMNQTSGDGELSRL